MPDTLGPQATNTTREYGLTLSGEGGASLAGRFDGSEAFRVLLWAGDDQAPLWQSDAACAWDAEVEDNPAGLASPELVLTVPRSAVEGLGEGTYQLQVLVNPDEDEGDVEAFAGFLKLTSASGTAEAPPAYTTFDDLEAEYSAVGDLQALGADQRGFAEAQAWARQQVDRALVARADAEVERADALGLWCGARRPGLEDIRTLLADDKLEVDDDLRRVCALFALHRVLRAQVGEGPGGTSYQALAAQYLAEARTALFGYRGRVDADGDGEFELVVG